MSWTAALLQPIPAGGAFLVLDREADNANLILGRTGEAFWQVEFFDHRVRDQAGLDLTVIVDYAEYNPVSAGLAANPREWHWSSVRLAGESACPTIGANRREM